MTYDLGWFPAKNSQNRAKINPIFPRKTGGYRTLILRYFSSPMAKYFPYKLFIIFDFGQLQREKDGQSCTKSATFGYLLFWISQRFLKHTLSLLEYCLWWKFHPNPTISGGELTPKKLQKRAISWMLNLYKKIWKFYNLTNANAILMKLTTMMYLHKTLNLAKDWGMTYRA